VFGSGAGGIRARDEDGEGIRAGGIRVCDEDGEGKGTAGGRLAACPKIDRMWSISFFLATLFALFCARNQ